jgi:hypothetical protein
VKSYAGGLGVVDDDDDDGHYENTGHNVDSDDCGPWNEGGD